MTEFLRTVFPEDASDRPSALSGWIITKEYDLSGESVVGTIGPRDINEATTKALESGLGTRFRLLDDDGEVMAEGRYFGVDGDEKEAFAPLNDFGMGMWGCTMLEYWKDGKGGGWTML